MLHSKKILCPIDFSESSVKALRTAVTLAPSDADFLILHVLQPCHEPNGERQNIPVKPEDLEEAQSSLIEIISNYLPQQLHARSLVQKGDVASEILQTARAEKSDLIVMPTHGASGWREFVLGSVTDEVVRLAPCPVLTMNASALAGVHKPESETNGIAAGNRPNAADERLPQHQPTSSTYGEDEFPLDGSPQAKLRFLLYYAVLAPSNRNSQPWLWRFNGDAIDLYADRMRALPHLDPVDRELILSCGSALMHLCLAIRHFGYVAKVENFPNPDVSDLLARVRLGEPHLPTEEDDLLFAAIFQRHTNRQPFLDLTLPASLIADMQADARHEGASLAILENSNSRYELIDLIVEADTCQSRNTEILGEAWKWIRACGDTRADGLRETSLGHKSYFQSNVDFSVQADTDRLLATNAPVIAVLETEDDTPHDWLAAGRALARLLLRASAAGVQANFFNSPIEVRSMWPQLHHLLRHASMPQMIVRLGYPSVPAEPTPRRPVSEVVQPGSRFDT